MNKNKRIILPFKRRKLRLKLGSSETTREAPLTKKDFKKKCDFNFDSYLNYSPMHIKKLNTHFLEWFIGFAEGDGSFYVKYKDRKDFRLGFDISQKDPKVLYFIKKTLGFGKICKYKSSKTGQVYWFYRVDTKKNIIRIAHLFNGNLILPKRKIQFHKWLHFCKPWLKPNFIDKQKNSYNSIEVSFETAWLAGFIDADGGFYANFSTPSPRSLLSTTLKQKIYITQKCTYGDKKVLEKIGQILCSKANVQPFGKKPKMFRLEMSSLETHQKVVQYLKKFRLKTNKWIAFLRWERVVIAREKQEHLNPNSLKKLNRLCKAINNLELKN